MTATDAHAATHPKLQRALDRLSTVDLSSVCEDEPPEALRRAVKEFNEGAFFEQHETLEELWLATPGEIRHLYEGILQVGVGMHHLFVNRNFHGAAVKLDHGARLLEAFPEFCHGIAVSRLRGDAQRARQHLLELGPDRLAQFNRDLVPHIFTTWDSHGGT